MLKRLIIIVLFSLIILPENLISQNNKISSDIADSIPIIYYKNHIYIIGEADSIHGTFVFDTGATGFYFDTSFYSENNFSYKNIKYAVLPGAGTTAQKVIVIMDTVNFTVKNNNYKTKIIPVLKLKPILGDISDGIIGWKYFSDKVLEINYKKKYLKIHNDISSVNISGYKKIFLKKRKNKFFIPLHIKINNSKEIDGEFLLDIGSGGDISLTNSVAEKYNLDKTIKNKVKYYTNYGGVGGKSSGYQFIADTLKVANFIFKKVTMEYSLDKSGALSSDEYFGLIGNEVLERFDIVIDFKESYLYLKPNAAFNNKFEFSRLGFSYVDRHETIGCWVVTGLYENSFATINGLKIGDKIISINNIPISQIKYNEQENFFNDLNDIVLKIKRGNNITEKNIHFKKHDSNH